MPQTQRSKTRDISEGKDSGVDMAFDALMNLEENSDLATFMKSYMKRGANSDCQLLEADENESLSR